MPGISIKGTSGLVVMTKFNGKLKLFNSVTHMPRIEVVSEGFVYLKYSINSFGVDLFYLFPSFSDIYLNCNFDTFIVCHT